MVRSRDKAVAAHRAVHQPYFRADLFTDQSRLVARWVVGLCDVHPVCPMSEELKREIAKMMWLGERLSRQLMKKIAATERKLKL